ncbi:MAG: ABC transporter ATP-binding protein [Ignavibacteriae bacterium]|nr:ABC transporter ATP-binding protein [Ignavibacteriota bacterium]
MINKVSLSIDKGEFLSILGASGSGKSTLLRLISNILPASSKHDLEGNVTIFENTPQEYLNTGKLSFMFQEAALMPNLNVVDNIKFPLKLKGDSINNSFINDLIEVIGLENHKNKYPSELSGGMKTRVSLARAFVTKPELLLLDEPFSALDVSWKFELYRYLKEFAAKYNTTVILVTHDIQESIVLGDKVVVISKAGSILREIKPHKESVRHYDVKSVNSLLKNNIEYFIDLQNEIRIDSIRENATIDEANEILDYLLDKTESNEIIQKHIIEQVQVVKPHITSEEIYRKLVKLWNETNQWEVKNNIMWRILDNPNATETIHKNIYDFIMLDWQRYVKENQSEEYFQKSKIFERTINRLQSQDYPSSKDWLYFIYLKAMSEGVPTMEKQAKSFMKSYCETHMVNSPVKDINSLIEYEK